MRATTNKLRLSLPLFASVAALALALFAFNNNLAHAATITVTTTADELDSNADCSLREAIQAANTDAVVDACAAGSGVDLIHLPAGTYDLGIGGSGEDLNATGDLDITSAVGIIGSDAMTTLINGAGIDRVFHVASGGVAVTSNLTIRTGLADSGGGIRNDGNLILINTAVINNSATGTGGGIYNAGDLNLYDSDVSDNVGAGIWSQSGTVSVIGSNVSRNTTTGGGGGVTSFGTLNMDLSTVKENSAGFGGGVFSSGTLAISNSTVRNNTARFGGGIASLFAKSNITNTTIFGNSANGDGSLEGGGGVFNNGSLALTNSTLSDNSSFSPGGGIRNLSPGVTTLRNTIVANSLSGGNCGGPTTDGGGNLSWPDSTCAGINEDPLLDPAGLQPNGGPTETVALQAGSPAIDAAVAASCPPNDQRFVSRPQGDGCDIGAFELEPAIAGVAADSDRDSFTDAVELHVGTIPSAACGPNAWPADTDDDGFSDISDLTSVSSHYGQAVTPAKLRYDLNQSAHIDISDVASMTAHFGSSCLKTR